MAAFDGWKTLSPTEKLVRLVQDVTNLKNRLRTYTVIQGMRLETRVVAGERHLFAVVQDSTVSNDGASYQITP